MESGQKRGSVQRHRRGKKTSNLKYGTSFRNSCSQHHSGETEKEGEQTCEIRVVLSWRRKRSERRSDDVATHGDGQHLAWEMLRMMRGPGMPRRETGQSRERMRSPGRNSKQGKKGGWPKARYTSKTVWEKEGNSAGKENTL